MIKQTQLSFKGLNIVTKRTYIDVFVDVLLFLSFFKESFFSTNGPPQTTAPEITSDK